MNCLRRITSKEKLRKKKMIDDEGIRKAKRKIQFDSSLLISKKKQAELHLEHNEIRKPFNHGENIRLNQVKGNI
jgi:hypothetical protein